MANVCGLAPNTIKIGLRELKRLNIVTTEQREGQTALRRINPFIQWNLTPVRKTTGVEKLPGLENGSTPSTKNVLPPGTKNAPQRVSKKGNPREGYPITVPLPFKSEAFSQSWSDWLKHLAQKRKKPGEMARTAQLAKCAQWGEERAITAIRHSIEGNYQGLYEPTNGTGTLFPAGFGNRSREGRRAPKGIPDYENAD